MPVPGKFDTYAKGLGYQSARQLVRQKMEAGMTPQQIFEEALRNGGLKSKTTIYFIVEQLGATFDRFTQKWTVPSTLSPWEMIDEQKATKAAKRRS